MIAWVTALAFVGWVGAAFAASGWMAERRTRIFVSNYRAYGSGEPSKATSWPDDDPETRLNETIDELSSIMGTRVRSGPGDNGKVEYEADTVENGIDYLLEVAREEGQQLSRDQAREEVEKMLNAEGPDML
jgi:hypothetical protein